MINFDGSKDLELIEIDQHLCQLILFFRIFKTRLKITDLFGIIFNFFTYRIFDKKVASKNKNSK